MPKLIDIHAHINFRDFREDGDEAIGRALDAGVWLINIGSQYSTSKRALEYAQKHEKGVYAAVGLHPIHLKDEVFEAEVKGEKVKFETKAEELDIEKYRELALDSKVVAVGEIGLDYYRVDDKELQEKQKEVFVKQLELAYELKKPVIIHCRDAHKSVIGILEKFLKDRADFKGGSVHCFSGNWEEAQQYFKLGFHISFTGLITFTHDWDKVIKNSPLDKLMAETDCPFMTIN